MSLAEIIGRYSVGRKHAFGKPRATSCQYDSSIPLLDMRTVLLAISFAALLISCGDSSGDGDQFESSPTAERVVSTPIPTAASTTVPSPTVLQPTPTSQPPVTPTPACKVGDPGLCTLIEQIDAAVRERNFEALRPLFQFQQYTCNGPELGEGVVASCDSVPPGTVIGIVYVGGWHAGGLGRTFEDALPFLDDTSAVESYVPPDVLAGRYRLERLALLTNGPEITPIGGRSVVGFELQADDAGTWRITQVVSNVQVADTPGSACTLCLKVEERIAWP